MTYPHEKTPTNTIKPKVATVIPVIKEKTEQQLELERIISAQLTERLFAPVTFEGIEKSVAYVTAANGLFKVTKTPIGLFKEQLEEFKTEVIGLPKMEIGVELAIPKIPMRKLIEALSYYRDINTKDRTEASVLFFWNYKNLPLPEIPGLSAEGQLVTYCPTQVNSAALSDFTMDLNVACMRTNLALLLETHSHLPA